MTGRRRGILALLGTVQFIVVLDTTIANVALPVIGRDLQLPEAKLQYVITLYAVTFGGLLMLAGRAGDLLGRRRLFAAGTLIFVAASAACGFSGEPAVLLAARAVQGVGAALISACGFGLLLACFEEGAERNKALSVWGGLGATGASAGLILGGVLTEGFGWQAVFLVNLPIGLVAAAVTGILPADPPTVLRGLDLPGAVCVTAGIGLLIYGTTRGQQDGLGSPVALGVLVASVLLLGLFVLIQWRSASPLIPLRIFTRGSTSGATVTIFLLTAVMGGQGFFVMLYLQNILGYSPVETGLAVLPASAMAFVGSVAASRLAHRLAPRVVAAGGLLLVAVAELMFARIEVGGSYVAVLPAFVLFGLGLGSGFVGASIVATTGVPAEDQGIVAGLMNTGQQVGIAVGVAGLVVLAVANTAGPATSQLVHGYRAGLLATVPLALVGAGTVLAARAPHQASQPTKPVTTA